MTPRKPHRRASGGTVVNRPAAQETPNQTDAPAPTEPSVLKVPATDDDPRVWGDGPEDRDAWLLEQRPPHWD